MKIKVVPFTQNNRTMYVGSIKARDIADKFKVDIWKDNHRDGYQRNPNMSRAKSFGRFVAKGHISPSSILINIRQNLKYSNGFLEIPDDTDLWCVDAQHRLYGLRDLISNESSFGDFEIPIIVTNLKEPFDEAEQFVVINRMQKGVRSDLAERFLFEATQKGKKKELRKEREEGILSSILKDISWVPTAVEVVDLLNAKSESVWHMKIQLPNESREDTITKQRSFTESLKQILNPETDGVLSHKDPKLVAEIISNYWEAWREIIPDTFKDPKSFVVQKTTGIFVLHRLFVKVADHCKNMGNDFKVSTIKKILQNLDSKYIDADWWSINPESGSVGAGTMGTSQKLFKSLAEEMIESLEENISEKEEEEFIVR